MLCGGWSSQLCVEDKAGAVGSDLMFEDSSLSIVSVLKEEVVCDRHG